MATEDITDVCERKSDGRELTHHAGSHAQAAETVRAIKRLLSGKSVRPDAWFDVMGKIGRDMQLRPDSYIAMFSQYADVGLVDTLSLYLACGHREREMIKCKLLMNDGHPNRNRNGFFVCVTLSTGAKVFVQFMDHGLRVQFCPAEVLLLGNEYTTSMSRSQLMESLDVVRRSLPKAFDRCHVTRCDIAVDVHGLSTEQKSAELFRILRGLKLPRQVAANTRRHKTTVYFGHSKSPYRFCLYDKSRQMWDRGDPGPCVPSNVLRCEVSLRNSWMPRLVSVLKQGVDLRVKGAGEGRQLGYGLEVDYVRLRMHHARLLVDMRPSGKCPERSMIGHRQLLHLVHPGFLDSALAVLLGASRGEQACPDVCVQGS